MHCHPRLHASHDRIDLLRQSPLLGNSGDQVSRRRPQPPRITIQLRLGVQVLISGHSDGEMRMPKVRVVVPRRRLRQHRRGTLRGGSRGAILHGDHGSGGECSEVRVHQ